MVGRRGRRRAIVRGEDQAHAGLPAAWRRQASATSASGSASWATASRRPRRAAARRSSAVPPLRGGQRVVRVAEDASRPAAQHRRGEHGVSPAAPPRLTSRPPGRRAPARPRWPRRRTPGRGRRRRRPAGASAAARPARRRRRRARRPRRRPAGRARSAPPRRPADRHHPAGAQRAGPRRRPTWPTAPPAPSTSTRSPGCSPARQVSAIQAATPDSPSAAAAASGTPSAQRDEVVVAGRRSARPGAVAGRHPGRGGEEHPRARRAAGRSSLDHADALHAGHVGHRRRPEVRGAGRAEQVERHDRCGGHPDQRPARRPAAGRGGRRGTAAARGSCRTAARTAQVAMSG